MPQQTGTFRDRGEGADPSTEQAPILPGRQGQTYKQEPEQNTGELENSDGMVRITELYIEFVCCNPTSKFMQCFNEPKFAHTNPGLYHVL